MDDATSAITSAFLVPEEGRMSCFQGGFEAISAKRLFCALYADRASHYRHPPEAGGKVDRDNPTQVGRALNRLGIESIPAYSPQARGRVLAHVRHPAETPAPGARAGRDHQHGRGQPVPARDLASPTATGTSPSGRKRRVRPSCPSRQSWKISSASRRRAPSAPSTRSGDNTKGLTLQIPEDKHRHRYVEAKVHEYPNGHLAIFHRPRRLADYRPDGTCKDKAGQEAA